MKFLIFALILAAGLTAAAPKSGDIQCELCTKVVKYVDDWLKSGAGHQEIELVVQKFCEMVGPEYEPICDAILEAEIAQVCYYYYLLFIYFIRMTII